MMHHGHTPGDQIKGLIGLGGIWLSWLIGHLPQIQQGVSILASLAAFTASIIYARYYLIKTRKEKRG